MKFVYSIVAMVCLVLLLVFYFQNYEAYSPIEGGILFLIPQYMDTYVVRAGTVGWIGGVAMAMAIYGLLDNNNTNDEGFDI